MLSKQILGLKNKHGIMLLLFLILMIILLIQLKKDNLVPTTTALTDQSASTPMETHSYLFTSSSTATTYCVYLPIVLANGGTGRSLDGGRTTAVSPCGVPAGPAKIKRTSPINGAADVAVTHETIIEFDRALDATTINAASIFAQSGVSSLAVRIHISPDRKRVTLFYNDPLPDDAQIVVTIDGDLLRDAAGEAVDVDDDGVVGGKLDLTFQTLSLAVVPGTAVCGRVIASELDVDDTGSSVDVPLEGVTITVDGAEDTLWTVSDGDGNFCLDPAPGSRFFVHINGRTATNGVPTGAYYPVVGKAWEPVAGKSINIGTSYLPLVVPDTLQPVSQETNVSINFPPSVLSDFPEFTDVMLTVPADSLFADDGTRGGMVGIAPVPPNRLPGRLPVNLNFPIVITVQTDGATNFDIPAPICFPNLPDPISDETLAANESTSLASFNHDEGRWEIVGSMTVTADGQLICTDPGVGIRAPGWHGAQQGSNGSGGGAGQTDCPTCQNAFYDASDALSGCLESVSDYITDGFIGDTIGELIPGLDCASAIADYINWADNCGDNAGEDCTIGQSLFNSMTTTIDCVFPAVGAITGPLLSAAECFGGLSDSFDALENCSADFCFGDGLQMSIDPTLRSVAVGDHLFAQQVTLVTAYNNLLDAVVGSPKWGDVAISEQDVLNNFYTELNDSLADTSPGGVQITTSEQNSLLGLALPSTISTADVTTLVTRLNQLAAGTLSSTETDAITTAALNLETVTQELQTLGWQTTFDGWLRGPEEISIATMANSAPVRLFYKVRNLETGLTMRGQLNVSGIFDNLILSPNRLYEVSYVHPASLEVGRVLFVSGARGGFLDVPVAMLRTATDPDSDGDGLSDAAEDTLGTDPGEPDSDGDGVNDGAEVLAGTDPLVYPIEIGDNIVGEISKADEVDQYTFTGAAGQSVYFDAQGTSEGSVYVEWRVLDEEGTAVFDSGIFNDKLRTLTAGGAYKLIVNGYAGATRAYQFHLWDVPPADTFAINIGDTVSDGVPALGAGNIETPGVEDHYTFTAAAGQTVLFDAQGAAEGSAYLEWDLLDPQGEFVFNSGIFNDHLRTLTVGGTYTIIVDGYSDTTRTYQFELVLQ